MLKEVVEKYPQDQVSVHVVWLPMVFGDSASAARSRAKMYGLRRVQQYYDEARLVGLAYRRDVFPDCLHDALSVMPEDHPLYAQLSEWATTTSEEVPLWDVALFYPPGVEWKERVPRPAAWSKQVGFVGLGAGETTGMFFRNDCKQLPTASDWHDEVRNAMKTLEQAQCDPLEGRGDRGHSFLEVEESLNVPTWNRKTGSGRSGE